MAQSIKIRRGLNIRLKGEAERVLATPDMPEIFAIKPPDFHGLVPQMVVKEGEKVKAGTIIFHDKYNKPVKFVSPVSGEIAEIVRGEKRRIMEVRILADSKVEYENLGSFDPSNASREDVVKKMLEFGLWPSIKQRPFDVVADPADKPRDIYISAFDSSPLAPDYDFVLHQRDAEFQAGLNAIAKLTDGKVYLGTKSGNAHDKAISNAKGVEVISVSGPHPAGNPGVQIHHTKPLNKGEVVWVINPQDIAMIGKAFSEGKYDATRVVALTGSEVKNARYHKMIIGSSIKKIVADNVTDGKVRYISGNPLTGSTIDADGFLGYYDHQVTVLPEGDEPQFFLTKGWLGPGLDKFSASRAFPTWLFGGKKYRLNTNNNGEERAFVVTGQYEKVFPFDIYPVYLIKSIITNDIERMENLGIYEVAPEDFALCEYVCTSKTNVQELVREGLDVIKRECT